MSAPAALVPRSADLPEPIAQLGIDLPQWRTLCQSLFPGANPNSVRMVIEYCKARGLDPLKKPCHIVPMRVKDAKTGSYEWRDVVMPGIYEYRTTAHRTGEYKGHTEPAYGPIEEFGGVSAPEWCAMTFFRRDKYDNTQTIPFPVRVYFRECVTLKDGKANDRWAKAPIQMLTKVCEAAGLREAFPDHFGGQQTAEEMIETQADAIDTRPAAPQPATRQSALAPPAASAPIEVEPAESVTVSAAANVGPIAAIHDFPNGTVIELATGFTAATKDVDLAKAARAHKDAGRVVELTTRPSSDPAKYAPTLEEIAPVAAE